MTTRTCLLALAPTLALTLLLSAASGFAAEVAPAPSPQSVGVGVGVDQVQRLTLEVEKLKIKLDAKDEGTWYAKPATIISLVALVFSLSTTLFSTYNSRQEEVRANRRDARALLQRLSTLPLENYELLQKFKGTGAGESLSGMINQENILLATQSAQLIERLPKSYTSTEYYAVAAALANSNLMSKVPGLYEQALKSATSSNDYQAAARGYGAYLYSKGNKDEGQRMYADAMNVWARYPERNTYVRDSSDLLTLMYWSQAVYSAGDKPAAREKLAQARQKLAGLPPAPYTDSLSNQLNYAAQFIEK